MRLPVCVCVCVCARVCVRACAFARSWPLTYYRKKADDRFFQKILSLLLFLLYSFDHSLPFSPKFPVILFFLYCFHSLYLSHFAFFSPPPASLRQLGNRTSNKLRAIKRDVACSSVCLMALGQLHTFHVSSYYK
jgi:hypothetical protein